MTEAAPPKPFFSRRRVIVGAVVVFVMVGVAGALWPSGGESGIVVNAKFVRFQEDVMSGRIKAVIQYYSSTDRMLHIAVRHLSDGRAPARFVSASSTGQVVWAASDADWIPYYAPGPFPVPSTKSFSVKEPHTLLNLTIPLPDDGRTGYATLGFQAAPRELPPLLEKVRLLWRRKFPSKPKYIWATCEQSIQCPKKLPDGTVEPPRLVSPPGAKP